MDRGAGSSHQHGELNKAVSDKLKTAKIEVERRNEVVVIRLEGELDALAGPALEDAANEAIASGARRCVIDLSEATFIDSIGVGALIRAHRSAAARGGAVCIAGPSGMIAQLIEVTQLDRVFPVFSTVDEAEAAPNPGAQ